MRPPDPMDDSIQFIIEEPQHTVGHKKRPRLVTSCDTCRLKKVKCIQKNQDPEGKCEACRLANVPCKFKDRERYFAERSRAIAGSAGYIRVNSPIPRSSTAAPLPPGDESPRFAQHPYNNVSSSASNRRSSSSPASPYPPPQTTNIYNNAYPPPSPLTSNARQVGNAVSASRHSDVQLFDPEHPRMPHPNLMPHFTEIFFERYSAQYPFMTADEIARKAWEGTLSPCIATCIAASAARYSDIPELTARGLTYVSEIYINNARALLQQDQFRPTMDNLHSLILLAWTEYKNSRVQAFTSYAEAVVRMAQDLGMTSEEVIRSFPDLQERSRLLLTWGNVIQLQSAVSMPPGGRVASVPDLELSSLDSPGTLFLD
ncbi:hypothetical protein FISHEDRAFT_78648 [Fistulina hepatica ATCC 64428]|uniref:Zn(2)-C6 fungal-type domain-containing protein n=1 Tax=Fistulina hepatica ATCC 64428 TaxID=1128425 RepID=A0A0D7A1L4_9AGAR|nr:hypothetical protein FISHEDRAFT_78648 [Fistulina hepatica ATCC 64428]